MISSCQIRAGRSLLGWSAAELAKHSSVGVATVRRYELQEGIPSGSSQTMHALQKTMESNGIEFTGNPLVNPGVTLHVGQRSED
jgi:hypothetical protein